MPFTLPKLPYALDALEPYIDRDTMAVHHGKHHAAYVKNLNAAIEPYPELHSRTLEELLRRIGRLPESIRATIRNNGGGHANHSMFWHVMSPQGGGRPKGTIGAEIERCFGGFETFKDQFSRAAMSVFGSGWVWLVDRDDTLAIEVTANQDSPIMMGDVPVLGLDLWEHAYYLTYQNRRTDYVAAWWHIVDWVAVDHRIAREAMEVVR